MLTLFLVSGFRTPWGRFAQILALSLLTLTSPLTGLAQAQPTDPEGAWQGSLDTPAGTLRLRIELVIDETGTQSGTLESLDQAPGQYIPLSAIEVSGETFSFSIAAIGAQYSGRWNEASQTYEGTFSQGMEFPLSLARAEAVQAAFYDGLDGVWETTLMREETALELVLNVISDDQGTRASLDSVSQGAFDLAVTDLVREGDQVGFSVPLANVTFSGVLDSDTLRGQWVRPNFPDATLTWQRTATAVTGPNRPQEPTDPVPYTVEEVRIANPQTEDIVLAGSFTHPDGVRRAPVALLLNGSGPQDRDETVWEHKPFLVLSDHLTRQGIAVLRLDDRGTGETTGYYTPATISDFVSDAQAALAWLKTRPDVDPDAIGIIGHSEGGLLAPMLAAQDEEIGFIILLAGPGTTGQAVILEQTQLMSRSAGATPEMLAGLDEAMTALTTAVRTAPSQDAVPAAVDAALTPERMAALQIPADMRQTAMAQMTRTWYRDFLRHDPAVYLRDVDQPVLALNGTLDVQVPHASNLAGIEAALAHNPDTTLMALDGRNHMFQRAQTGAIPEYAQIEETLDPMVLELISDWIAERFETLD